ncbi:flavin-containing monooxygenase 5-like [Biomphalaria glabrata]|uniref:Flavin-containing monooxygenase n=1 Tax=Biomphalaria glabrata TaxID=6526 RepID=A0A9U8E0R7_BIOGL|nr:flavin-containing monooxygenase 5-like [Biomphalaria glabrata]XP_013068491.2 flavin-containing monooxygenase 5-like [Biomphalaria glabrata]XP_055897518.1 flavin-containing monooxygenase 5-like [Biomphalaria glabrata]
MEPKRVAVIGAGASGLVAIKACLDEGLVPVCFERTEHIGGLWRYTDKPVDGQACVMKSTVINTSKEIMAYSDFPIPAEFPIFMHNSHVYEYFKMYADNFKLAKHIKFNIEVLYVKRSEKFAITGQWEIKYRDKETDGVTTETFDGVLVCTGHHAEKYEPTFPGLSQFQGKVIHTHDYRKPEGFEDKRVLIIGVGNSGGDAAVELSRIASQVFLSTRRGTWILNRISDRGYPLDMVTFNRPMNCIIGLLPSVFNKLIKKKVNDKIDHDVYGLTPEHGVFQQHPMVNDDLPNRIICGSVKIKTDVKRFTSTGVEFMDGTFEDNIDIVLLATGYVFGFPFIDKEIIDVKENRVQLYKYMYPPDLEKNTLAVIGCFQPLGAIMPIAEMQCRLATRVIKGESFLPPKQRMWEDIREKEANMAKRYVKSQRHTIQVDYLPFMDELAELVGCKVDNWDLLKKDPVLAFKVMFDTVTPYTYRLYGPGKWQGARNAIMNQWDRTLAPLKTRPLPSSKGTLRNSYLFNLAIVLAVFFLLRFLLSLF